MKKHILILALVLVPALISCTQNGGHIGRLFGTWVLTERTLNGDVIPAPMPDCEFYMSFQSDVALFKTVENLHDIVESRVCTWSRSGEDIVFNFDHANNGFASGGYTPPAWLEPEQKEIRLTATHSTDSRLECMRIVGSDVYTYKFSRTW